MRKHINVRTVCALAAILFSNIAWSAESANNEGSTVSEISAYVQYVPERNDDIAWENDLVAFRAYGPAARNMPENSGIDAWMKYVSYPVVEKRYKQHLSENKSYHEDWGDGYDIYHVGSSAGVGNEALWIDGQRIGLETWKSYEIISQSREAVVFELTHEIEIKGVTYKLRKKISLALGSQLFNVVSTFTKDGMVAKNMSVAIGVSTHDESASALFEPKKGYIATWERLSDNFGIGTGVLVKPERVLKSKTILSDGVKDAGHALFIVNTDQDGRVEYMSGFAWQRAGVITSHKQWMEYLGGYKVKWAGPN